MAIIEAKASPTARAIDAWQEQAQDPRRLVTLRASGLGEPCERKLWYALRWAHAPERHPARILRIFDNGHGREAVIIDLLRKAGLTVEDRDPATGEQWRVSFAGGKLAGSADGVVTGVPEAPKARHLLEIKTMNDARWNAWRRKGVMDSDPKYWVQCQVYMHGLGLTRALLVCENQNTKEIDTERLDYAPGAAMALVSRAERLFDADTPPERAFDNPDWYQCRSCPAREICWQGAMPERTCRTCGAFTMDGATCDRHGRTMDLQEQGKGCDFHLLLPPLVDGDVISTVDDASGVPLSVTYRMRDGSTWTDGMGERV